MGTPSAHAPVPQGKRTREREGAGRAQRKPGRRSIQLLCSRTSHTQTTLLGREDHCGGKWIEVQKSPEMQFEPNLAVWRCLKLLRSIVACMCLSLFIITVPWQNQITGNMRPSGLWQHPIHPSLSGTNTYSQTLTTILDLCYCTGMAVSQSR